MYMYLDTDKRDRKMNNIKTVQRKGRVQQNRLKYSDVKIFYKTSNVVHMAQNDGNGTDQVVQKKDNIEKGIIVYVKTLNQLGKVENVNEKTYSIRFFSNIIYEINKEDVLPMYSNTGSSNKVFSSVMGHGVLSPKERKSKTDKWKDIFCSATTDDAKNADYEKTETICVNVFSIGKNEDSEEVNIDEAIFTDRFRGAYLVALENKDAPKIELPSAEDCERQLGEPETAEIEELRDELRKTGIDEESIESWVAGSIYDNYFKSNHELMDPIKQVFEERLKRTMFVIAKAPDDGINDGERKINHILSKDFMYVLLPVNSYVDISKEKVKEVEVIKVGLVEEELEVPAYRCFSFPKGEAINIMLKMKIQIPDYREAIKKLPPGKYYSHIVRL